MGYETVYLETIHGYRTGQCFSLFQDDAISDSVGIDEGVVEVLFMRRNLFM